jgi:hypothetical protein
LDKEHPFYAFIGELEVLTLVLHFEVKIFANINLIEYNVKEDFGF